MPEVQENVRSVVELDAQRARAKMKRDDWGPLEPLYAAEGQAVLDTIAWLTGETRVGPATGEERPASDVAVAEEWLRSRDDEHEVRGHPESWRPGAIARTLSWYMRLGGAEAPV